METNMKSKDMFLAMRAEEVAQMYPSDFSKKEASKVGKEFIVKACDDGNVSKHELMSNIVRLKAVIDAMETELRTKLPEEKQTCLGVEFVPNNGRKMIQYSDDHIWSELSEKLKQREELLKVAEKSTDTIYDSEGIEVTKCGSKYSKSSITISF